MVKKYFTTIALTKEEKKQMKKPFKFKEGKNPAYWY
jgi:hypothetical protein